MKVSSLQVQNFRNLKGFTFNPSGNVNVIFGENAQGKTNLLESMWLFTGARSFRGSKSREMLHMDGGILSLELDFHAQGRDQNAIYRFSPEKAHMELNGVKQDRLTAMGGIFCAVVFSPDDIAIIKNGPELRRRMIDTALFQAYPRYAKAADNYQKALKQRNALLRDITRYPQLSDMLDIWDRHIAEYGGYICKLRAGYLLRVAHHASGIYSGISGGRENLSLIYRPGFNGVPAAHTVEEYQQLIAQSLLENRSQDLKLAATSTGPHRDDLDILIDGKSARVYGSQGQQRSCILAIKLAECAILEEHNGEPPVVMLDDVMSELDRGRRDYLLHHLTKKQIFITACDSEIIPGQQSKQRLFHMEQGRLSEWKE